MPGFWRCTRRCFCLRSLGRIASVAKKSLSVLRSQILAVIIFISRILKARLSLLLIVVPINLYRCSSAVVWRQVSHGNPLDRIHRIRRSGLRRILERLWSSTTEDHECSIDMFSPEAFTFKNLAADQYHQSIWSRIILRPDRRSFSLHGWV